MHTLEVGKEFTLFDSYEKGILGTNGCVFEALEGGGFALVIYLTNISKTEEKILKKKMQVKLVKETDTFILLLVRFGTSPLIFEIEFDPTLYSDDRKKTIKESNWLSVIVVESTNNIVKILRTTTINMRLYRIMLAAWEQALQVSDFSNKYKNWTNDLRSRYSVLDLWNYYSQYIGKMGE